jgi:hypothetical protein
MVEIGTYLKNHFDSKYAGKCVIEVIENVVSEASLFHRIFSGESDATQTDDYHDKKIEVRQVHHPVSSAPDPV